MKKSDLKEQVIWKWLPPDNLKMKLTTILLIISLFKINANTYSQHTKVSLNMNNASLIQVFDEIESQSDFRFLYNHKKIDVNRKVSLLVEKQPISEVLDKIFADARISYAIKRKLIVLSVDTVKPTISKEVVAIQEFAIKGAVVDVDGVPLSGASIVEKGTTNGTQTDFDGNFTIKVSESNAILQVSYIGYASQEIQWDGASTLAITLKESAAGLEEVVVVGYGTQKKSDLTGSVVSVSEKAIQSRPVPSFQDAIQGRATGVNVRQSGGDLSGKFDISIRGIGSVTGSNAPLIVVDGIPLFSADFSTINPKDIASINILKDASASAIYGARASNGVVIISTKRGNNGKARFTFSAETGFEKIAKKYDLLTTEQQRLLLFEAFKNSNRNTAVYDDPSHPAWQVDNDWQDLGTQTAVRKSYNFGVTGGSEKSKYAVSASILDREGVMVNTDIKSWNLRANIDSQINDRFSVSGSLAGSYQTENFIENDSFFGRGYRTLVFNHSYTPAYDENGDLDAVNTTVAPYFGGNNNPLIDILLPNRERKVSRLLGSVKLNYELADGLAVALNSGGDILTTGSYIFNPVYEIGRFSRPEGNVNQSSSEGINWVTELTMEYNKAFGAHNLKALVGVSAQQFTTSFFQTRGSGTINNALNQLSNQTTFTSSGAKVSSGLSSTFFRSNYNYDNKYFLTGTVRRDGSSRFGPGNRFGIFPSGSVAWKLSEEDFLKDNETLSSLKLRASYGLTGNQNIGDFAFITKVGGAGYTFGDTAVNGSAPLNIGNKDLKWESSKQLDVGLNASFFNGRLSVEMDYYDKRSEDLLIAPPIPLTTGVDERPIVNVGSVKNAGFEFAVNSKNLTGAVKWSTDFNISYNKNEVLDIGLNSKGEPLELPGAQIPLGNELVNLTKTGHEVGAFYMYEFDGIWQIGEEAEAAAWSNAVPGDAKYVDKNGNGTFDQGDRDFTGTSPHPAFFGGLNNNVVYKNFSVSVFMNFATGYQLYNSARNLFSRSVPFVQNFAEVADFWTPDNPSNTVPRPSQGGNTTFLSTRPSTRFLEDASFLKIKNISLGYNLPDKVIDKIGIQAAKLTLTGTNLVTFTKYTGLDPEASSIGSLLSVGQDHTPYPSTKLYSLALEFSF